MITVRTKIKQQPSDALEFADESKSIYPKNLELPDRLPKKRGTRSIYTTDGTFEEYVQENFNV